MTGGVEAGALCCSVHRGESECGIAAEPVHLKVVDRPALACWPCRLLEAVETWRRERARVRDWLLCERCRQGSRVGEIDGRCALCGRRRVWGGTAGDLVCDVGAYVKGVGGVGSAGVSGSRSARFRHSGSHGVPSAPGWMNLQRTHCPLVWMMVISHPSP